MKKHLKFIAGIGITALTLPTLLTLLTLQGCSEPATGITDNSPVRFETRIDDRRTRASGVSWDSGDQIGIYVAQAGGSISGGSLYSNVKYVTSGDGDFAAPAENPGDAIYYPATGKVDFVAYYPYDDALTGTSYPVDVSTQSDLAAIDLLWSNNAKGLSEGIPRLEFRHKLSRLVFRVVDRDGAPLDGLGLIIDGMKTKAAFDLSSGTFTLDSQSEDEIEAATSNANEDDEEEAVFEAIVIPDTGADLTLSFAIDGGEVIASHSLSNVTYKPGYVYTYNVTLISGAEAVEIESGGIHGWENDPDTVPGSGDLELEKKPEDGGGNGGGNGPDPTDGTYYLETFGKDEGNQAQAVLQEFKGWTSGLPNVVYTSAGKNATVMTNAIAGGPCVRFMSNESASYVYDISISGLPEGYADITFGCNIIPAGLSIVNPMKLYSGEKELTPVPAAGLTADTPYEFSAALPDGATSVRFTLTIPAAGATIFVDNISLSGRKAD